jgi:adenine/guanine phosphoribosyltransferase-like PRPP-binding protein
MIKDDPRIEQIKGCTQVYENFPKKGVNFLDIFPICADSRILGLVTDIFAERLEH